MDLFDLFVRIGVDDDDLEKGLDKAKEAVGVAGKAMAAAFSVAAAGAVALVKESVDAYANYEQLVGGVETLFSNLEGTVSAAPAVLAKANEAFKTAGMSANQYMETVTSFSAALISSLEGDYDKAAEISDMAITDMADNANKMGSSLESLQTAYAGFAKQNYTMLDNLKLGYGGTKAEMERLLKDAEKFSGVKYDISNLSDVYEAIHVVQEQMGIAGATAEEAATTIEGSFNALKGAWENLVTGFSNKDADLNKLVTDVVDSATVAFENLKPVIETAISGLIESVESFIPIIGDMLPTLANDLLPRVIDAAQSIVNTLATALPSMLKVIVDLIPNLTTEIVQTMSDLAPEFVNVGADMIDSLANGLSETLPDLIPIAVDAILNFTDSLVDNLDTVVDAAIKIIIALAEGLSNALPKLIAKAPEIIIKLATALAENIGKLNDVPPKIINTIADGLVHADWTSTAEAMMDGLISSLDVAQKKVKFWIDKARQELTGESIYNGDFENVASTDFINHMETGKDVVVDAIDDASKTVAKSYDSFYNSVNDGNKKVAEAAKQAPDAYSKISGTINDYAKSLETQSKQWKTVSSAATEEVELSEKEMKAALENYFRDLESQMYEEGRSESWLLDEKWKYVEALDHNTELFKDYNNKLLKAEKTLSDKLAKEEQTQIKANNQAIKDALLEKFRDIETLAEANGYTEQWLIDQERTYIEALDHNTDLYKEYNLKLIKAENKLNEDLQKERAKEAESTKKSFTSMVDDMVKAAKTKIEEYQKVVDNIKTKIQTFADKLKVSYKDMFKFETDEKTGKTTAIKTNDFLTDRVHQLEAYYDNIVQLKERVKNLGIGDDMLKQLSGMSAEEGAAVAEYWMKLDDTELKKLDKVWDRYENTTDKVANELYADDLESATQELDTERNTLLDNINTSINTEIGKVVSAMSDANENLSDLKSLIDSLNQNTESVFGQGISVNLDGTALVGQLMPAINLGLGTMTKRAMRGG